MEVRLQKLLSAAGVCSRREAEAYLLAGRVSVNGKTAVLGQKADPEQDRILLDGAPLAREKEKLYLMLNKPKGYITTTSDEKGRKTVLELLGNKFSDKRIFPVGRLDY